MAELKLGDSAEVLKTCPGNYIDLVVTSPPYDNLRTYKGFTFNFEIVAKELVRVLKPGGVIVWVVNDATINGSETGTSFKQALYFTSLGLNLHDTMIYQKLNPIPLNHNRYEQEFEYMFVLSKGKPKTVNHIKVACTYGGKKNTGSTYYKTKEHNTPELANKEGITNTTKNKGNIWSYLVGNHNGEAKFKHPAKFPLQLALDHIQSWSNSGDIVLDPFLGSGTTGVAALQLGRRFIGIEISEEYLQIAKQRINEAQNE
jgi:site-specific DNA-methyltransferase (adenine-specific)